MPSMFKNKTNNYIENPKRSDIETPKFLCDFLYRIVSKNYFINSILDPCSGNGNLYKPFLEANPETKIIEFEIKMGSDFFKCQELEFIPDLVLCNPPFNGGIGQELLPFKFLKHIFELCGKGVRLVLITPDGLLNNQKITSPRWKWLRDNSNITHNLRLPLDIFEGVLFHIEVLFLNLYLNLPRVFFLDDEAISDFYEQLNLIEFSSGSEFKVETQKQDKSQLVLWDSTLKEIV